MMRPVEDLYPSRTGQQEQILPRLDPVVYPRKSSGSQPLSEDKIDFYETNGYLTFPDAMTSFVDPLLAEIEELKSSMAGEEEFYTEPDSSEVRTLFRPHKYSWLIDQFSRHPFILDRVRQLLGSEVYLMQSRVNIKPAYRGKSFAWHSDFETWHVEDGLPRMRTLTVWLMLTDNTPFNGPLYVIPGSHRQYVSCRGKTGHENFRRSLKQQTLGVPQPHTMDRILATKQIRGIHGKPGTLVFHECNLLHGSPDNIANTPRSILMFVYNSCENKPVAPFGGQPPRPDYLSSPDHRALVPSYDNRFLKSA
jgi:ectoine hydroxylase